MAVNHLGRFYLQDGINSELEPRMTDINYDLHVVFDNPTGEQANFSEWELEILGKKL
jgi:hypothetical protein